MKRFNKMMAVLLAICMVLAIMPVELLAVENTDPGQNVESVVTEYKTLKVHYTGNGTVTTDPGLQGDSVTVEKGKVVVVTATPDTGYRVAAITVKKGDDVEKHTFGAHAYAHVETVVMNEDCEIEVTFSSNTHSIETVVEPAAGGKVEVNAASVTHGDIVNVKVTAENAKGYEIKSVTVNGNDMALANRTNVTFNLAVTEDMHIRAVFTLKKHSVTIFDHSNGEVSVWNEQGENVNVIEHGQKMTVKIKPEAGYNISSVEVNGVKVNNYKMSDLGLEFTVNAVTAPQNIAVLFEVFGQASLDGLFEGKGVVRSQGNLIVFANDGSATFMTEKTGILIYGTDGKLLGGGENQKRVSFDYNVTIGKIEIYEALGNGLTKRSVVSDVSNVEPLELVFDKTAPNVELKVKAPNKYGYYYADVPVTVLVSDPGVYSGIEKVTYQVLNNGNNTQSGELSVTNGQATIVVDAAKNNSDQVVVVVTATDKAGNTAEMKTGNLKINKIAPVLESVKIVEEAKNAEAEAGFYTKRVLKLTIVDRADTFQQDSVKIHVTAKDAAGNQLDPSGVKITWANNGDRHEATIDFGMDANFQWSVSYANKANLNLVTSSAKVDAEDVYAFTVDNKKPTGQIRYADNVWTKLLDKLTFGIWSKNNMNVTAQGSDEISPVKAVQFYKSNKTTAMTEAELDAAYKAGSFRTQGYAVSTNERFAVYARIVDHAGNVTYVSTNGMVFDKTASRITITPEEPDLNGLYNGDVQVKVAVTDAINGSTEHSGIKSVTYRVFKNNNFGEATQSGTLYSFNQGDPTAESLKASWDGTVTVQSKLNDSNDVTLVIYTEDNAGNLATERISLKIDVTAPVIEIDYNYDYTANGSYYNTSRIATVKILERNYDPNAVKFVITNTDGTIPKVPVKITDWTKVEGKAANGNDTAYIAQIVFEADGDYTIAAECTDVAGLTCGNIKGKTYDRAVSFAAGTANPTAFTIDKTAPVVSVSYDNNDAENEKFFKAPRIATVTIIEHNFPINQLERIAFAQTADRDGVIPEVVWEHVGNTHTATFVYSVDGDYTFGVTMTDLAGNESGPANYGDSVAAQDFVIDTTFEDMVTITGVKNGAGYGDVVIPGVEIADINLQDCEVTLTGVQKDQTIDLTAEVNKRLVKNEQDVVGIFDIFEMKQELDGVYTLAVKATDKAGNEDVETVIFIVNRFGSVYMYDQYLMDLIAAGGKYVISVDEDLVITEYNADKLVENSAQIEITIDGRPLENAQYTVTAEAVDITEDGSRGWYQYTYTISKDNFKTDGVYKISVSSKDATGNTPDNDNYEDMGIMFRVDSTQAEITSVVGLEESIINATEVTVKYMVFDTIGLKNIKVYVNGQLLDEVTDFSADMNNYSGEFVIKEQTAAQNVQIVVEDMAGNITDTNAEEFSSAYAFNRNVTVSTNIFVRWYANKALFWGSIAAAVALAGGAVFAVVAKRKKKVA